MVDIVAAMDDVSARTGVRRFVIAGICSGANNGLNAALQDERVAGLVMIDGHAYPNWRTFVLYYAGRLFAQSPAVVLRTAVSKGQHQHSCLYYFPDYYKAKFIIGNKVVKEHDLLIKSDGWLTAVETKPAPVYFKKEEVLENGKMALSIEKIKSKNIEMLPKAPLVLYSNVQDFGKIYSDDFTFETALKNDYKDGASVCQTTRIYVLCENTVFWIPLSTKGCIAENDLYVPDKLISGEKEDLSAFGVDFQDFIKVKMISKGYQLKIWVNNALAFQYDKKLIKAKIIGIDFTFEGTGSVDYVKLWNEKVHFEDAF